MIPSSNTTFLTRALESRQGRKQKVHSLIDKVFSRKNLELAWEKVKRNRGSAGIDKVTIEQFEARREEFLGSGADRIVGAIRPRVCRGDATYAAMT